MNCIPSSRLRALWLCAALCAGCNTQVADSAPPSDPLAYQVRYDIKPDRSTGAVAVTMRVSQHRALLREIRMRPDDRVRDIDGDGDLLTGPEGVTWRPPAQGGSMSWQVDVAHRRNGDGYDAYLGMDWGLFRAEDVIPRASTRTLKGAHSETSLAVDLPAGWSVVTEYYNDQGRFLVDNTERRFDQPSGWIVVGKLGVRRETIAGMRVAVAGPAGQSIRRMDTLALLHWTLPELARLLPELPRRLTVVSASDPMWRGGLSAPQSVFLHAARPLISENATSTLLHEVMHMSLGLSAVDGYDWIVEGLAEYYSLQLLRRSGSISVQRYQEALRDIERWADSASELCRTSSAGATTALAVTVFLALDQQIRELSADESDLDDVVVAIWESGSEVNLEQVDSIVMRLTGDKPDALHIDNLPGCRNIGTPE